MSFRILHREVWKNRKDDALLISYIVAIQNTQELYRITACFCCRKERRVNTRIGLIDVDGHNYPNLPLMKISAWHKKQGDSVEWYDPWIGLMDEYDKVYMSKVFSFTPDYEHPVYAKEVSKGGERILHQTS